MKHQLYSVLIVVCVSHAFDKFEVTSDSSASLGLGLDVGGLKPSTNVGLGLVDGKTPWTRPGFVSNDLAARHSRSEENQRTATESAVEYVQNRSSELADLFAVGSSRPRSDASITSSPRPSSTAKLVNLEGGSYVKTDQIKTNVNGSMASFSPTPSVGLLPTNSSIVPSEGGVLQEGLPHTYTRPTNIANKDTRPTLEQGLGLGRDVPAREGVSSLVNTQLESQGSHISARKGATPSDQMESANGTMVPSILTSSKIDLDSNFHTQKVTPRKEAEAPKIYPRKGVDASSSDQFLSDINNNNRTTVSVSPGTARTTAAYSSLLADNHTEIVKHINTSKAGMPSLQNGSRSTIGLQDMTEKTSSQYVNSESSISTLRPTSSVPMPTIEAITSKTKPTSDAEATNSNSVLNVTVPLPIDMKNVTLGLDKLVVDKSGIIASYPPLKKRPKPLKTTDLNSVNSSPITPEHSSSEHDYVIPIVVTILTVPMLVVLVLFLYKKGSEFWERRHYRRMDFLIDGMYND